MLFHPLFRGVSVGRFDAFQEARQEYVELNPAEGDPPGAECWSSLSLEVMVFQSGESHQDGWFFLSWKIPWKIPSRGVQGKIPQIIPFINGKIPQIK